MRSGRYNVHKSLLLYTGVVYTYLNDRDFLPSVRINSSPIKIIFPSRKWLDFCVIFSTTRSAFPFVPLSFPTHPLFLSLCLFSSFIRFFSFSTSSRVGWGVVEFQERFSAAVLPLTSNYVAGGKHRRLPTISLII